MKQRTIYFKFCHFVQLPQEVGIRKISLSPFAFKSATPIHSEKSVSSVYATTSDLRSKQTVRFNYALPGKPARQVGANTMKSPGIPATGRVIPSLNVALPLIQDSFFQIDVQPASDQETDQGNSYQCNDGLSASLSKRFRQVLT